MRTPEEKKSARSFYRLLEWPSALGLGTLAAFLYSLKQVNPVVRIEVDTWSWVILVIGTVAAWFLTHSVFKADEDDTESSPQAIVKRTKRKRMILLIGLLGGGMGFSLIYALKDIPPSKRFDVSVGVLSALLFVSVALYFFYRLVQFLERHGEEELKRQAEEDERYRKDKE